MEEEGYNVADPVTDPARLEEIAEDFENAATPTVEGSGGGDFETEPGGEENSGWSDIRETTVGDDTGRDNTDGEYSGTGEEESSENAGSEGTSGEPGSPLDVRIEEQPISVDVESFEAYEGVKAEDFEEYSEMVNARLDAMSAMCLVIMVALFLSCGIAAVDTLVRRFERQ